MITEAAPEIFFYSVVYSCYLRFSSIVFGFIFELINIYSISSCHSQILRFFYDGCFIRREICIKKNQF